MEGRKGETDKNNFYNITTDTHSKCKLETTQIA